MDIVLQWLLIKMKSLMFTVFILYGMVFSATLNYILRKIIQAQFKQVQQILFLNTLLMFAGAFFLFLPALWSVNCFLVSIASAMLTQLAIVLFLYFQKRFKHNSPS